VESLIRPRKNYVISMKKFLGKVSPLNPLSELESRASHKLSAEKIKKLLNTPDYP